MQDGESVIITIVARILDIRQGHRLSYERQQKKQ